MGLGGSSPVVTTGHAPPGHAPLEPSKVARLARTHAPYARAVPRLSFFASTGRRRPPSAASMATDGAGRSSPPTAPLVPLPRRVGRSVGSTSRFGRGSLAAAPACHGRYSL